MRSSLAFVALVVLVGSVVAAVEEVPLRRPGGGGGGGGGSNGNRPGGSRPPPGENLPDATSSESVESKEDSDDAEKNPCDGLLIGVLPHPTSCYKWISCYKEVATEETCPVDSIFDLDEITCVPGNQRTCRKDGDPYPLPGDMCRGIVLGSMLHPEDCTKYVSCLLGRARERSCRRGFVFSERLFVCLPGDANSCTVTLLPTTTTVAPEPIPTDICRRNNVSFGVVPHPQLCTRYISCTLWIPIERECGRFQVFSERFSICLPGNVNTCRPILGREQA
uniref:Chitin-binding type-2 domain-containing protein n=1 Tax=Anopheles atroparvus TaxID=41427 RepID=A0AAG5DFX5_ANOAO